MHPLTTREMAAWTNIQMTVSDEMTARATNSRRPDPPVPVAEDPAADTVGDRAEKERQDSLDFLHRLIMG